MALKYITLALAVGFSVANPGQSSNASIPQIAVSPLIVEAASDPVIFDELQSAFSAAEAEYNHLQATENNGRRVLWDQCSNYTDLYIPECHLCNNGGCGWFKCSAFTYYDKCREGFEICKSETCVSGFCSAQPTCGRRKVVSATSGDDMTKSSVRGTGSPTH